MKSVFSLVLKKKEKRKVTVIVCVFYQKRQLKIEKHGRKLSQNSAQGKLFWKGEMLLFGYQENAADVTDEMHHQIV